MGFKVHSLLSSCRCAFEPCCASIWSSTSWILTVQSSAPPCLLQVLNQCGSRPLAATELQLLADLQQQLQYVWAGAGGIPLPPQQLQQPSSILRQYSTAAAAAASSIGNSSAVTSMYVARLLELALGSSDQLMGMLNGWIAAVQLTMGTAAAPQKQQQPHQLWEAEIAPECEGTPSSGISSCVGGVAVLDLLCLLRQRRHDPAVVGWLAALQQRQQIELTQRQQREQQQQGGLLTQLLLGQPATHMLLGCWKACMTTTSTATPAAVAAAAAKRSFLQDPRSKRRSSEKIRRDPERDPEIDPLDPC